MDLFILQERLSESQYQQELAATKLRWSEKYWNYYQSRFVKHKSQKKTCNHNKVT